MKRHPVRATTVMPRKLAAVNQARIPCEFEMRKPHPELVHKASVNLLGDEHHQGLREYEPCLHQYLLPGRIGRAQ